MKLNAYVHRFALACIAALALFTAGCGEDLGAGGPGIVSVEISPSELLPTDLGMTDEYFTVTITTEGFTEELDVDATRVFYVDGAEEVDGVFTSSALSGDTITLSQIATTWFQGQPAGTYDIGVEVVSVAGDSGRATESAEEVGLATVTILDQ